MTVTTGMVGHGFYNRNSAPQWAAIESALPWLEAALQSMDLPSAPEVLALADFGCSEGRNSIAVMQRLLPVLRRRTTRPLATIHSDLPTNDYSALLTGLRREDRSVFPVGNVYSGVVGGSMYDELLPPASLHVAMSFNAVGYLSRRPLERLPGYILANGPNARRRAGAVTAEERAAVARQSADDIQAFLTARAAELVPGGKLLVQVFGADGSGCTGDGIFDALNDALVGLRDVGRITGDEYERFYQPVYFRRLEELVAAVAETSSALSGLYRLERAETHESQTPFVEDYRATGDAAAYAGAFTSFFRAFTEPVLRMAFSRHADIDVLVGDIYSSCERLIREDPTAYMFRYISVAALMTRL